MIMITKLCGLITYLFLLIRFQVLGSTDIGKETILKKSEKNNEGGVEGR